jgi:hypothetical protein
MAEAAGGAPAAGAVIRAVKSRSVTGDVTVTAHEAVAPPSAVVTVMFAVPGPTAVTTPPLTLATPALLDAHVIAGFVALAGMTAAVRLAVTVSPRVKPSADALRLTLVTDT